MHSNSDISVGGSEISSPARSIHDAGSNQNLFAPNYKKNPKYPKKSSVGFHITQNQMNGLSMEDFMALVNEKNSGGSGQDLLRAEIQKRRDRHRESSVVSSILTEKTDADDEKEERMHRKRPIKQGIKLWRRRFYAVIWTNFIIRYRNKWFTITEILLPILVMGICLISLSSNLEWSLTDVNIELSPEAQRAKDEGGISFEDLREYFLENSKIVNRRYDGNASIARIFYFPDHKFINDIMERVAIDLYLDPKASLRPVDNESDVMYECLSYFEHNKNNQPSFPIGIIFEKEGLSSGKVIMKSDFSYKIRTFFDEIVNTVELFPYYAALKIQHNISPYIKTGFLALQYAIDKAYLENVTDWLATSIGNEKKDSMFNSNQVQLKLRMFPYSIYLDSKVRFDTWFYILTSFTIGYMLTNFLRTRQLIRDRGSGIIELFQCHGMSTTIFYSSGIVNELVLRMFTSIFLTLLFFSSLAFTGGFFRYSNGILVWIILVLHGVAEINCSLMIAHFFKNGILGACTVNVISFISYIIPMSLYQSHYLQGKFLNILLCILFPNWSLANGVHDFLKFETYDAGLSWSSLATWADDVLVLLPIGIVIVTSIFSSILYFTMTIYLDKITAKIILSRKGYCFCCSKCSEIDPEATSEAFPKPIFKMPKIYEANVGNHPVIICNSVTFTYPGSDLNLVLNNFCADFFKNQVSVLVGRTGCGKTTLLKVLGQILPPNKGEVHIKGLESNLVRKYRKQLIGILPENHVLYESLSVEEHIRLCCQLHGHKHKNSKIQTKALMFKFDLYNARNVGIKHLDEQMKRRVSLAVAFTNSPSILLLDSPTLGMDAKERKGIWDTICSFKSNRCIIVTASTLDEAELFADRILLMDGGKVIACGSPSFLRNNYNTGAFLKLYHPEDTTVNSKQAILSIVKGAGGRHVENIREVILKGSEHHSKATYFSLPPPPVKYSKIFEELEQQQDSIGYTKMTVNHVTLTTILHQIVMDEEFPELSHQVFETNTIDAGLPSFPPEVKKQPSYLGKLLALKTKHFAIIRHKYKLIALDFLISLTMIAFFMIFSVAFFGQEAVDVSRPLSVQTYPMSRLPVLLFLPEELEYKKWKNATKSVVKDTRGRIVFFSPVHGQSQKFYDMFKSSKGSLTNVAEQVVMGISREHSTFAGYYASNALHAAPSVFNFMTNLDLHFLTPDEYGLGYSHFMKVHTFNHPILLHNDSRAGTVRETTDAMIGILFSLPIAIYAGSKINQGLQEKVSGSKWFQFICGVTPFQYWFVAFLTDMILTVLFASFFVAIICILDVKRLFTKTKFDLFCMIIFYVGWAFPPFSYFLSQYLPTNFSGQSFQIFIQIVVGILPSLFTHLFLRGQYAATSAINGILSIFPPFTITAMFINYFSIISSNSFCDFVPLESETLCYNYEYNPKSFERDEYVAVNDVYFKSCCAKYCEPHGTCHTKHGLIKWGSYGIYGLAEYDLFTGITILIIQGAIYWIVLLCFEYKIFTLALKAVRENVVGDTERTRVQQVADYVGDSPEEVEAEMLHVIDITEHTSGRRLSDSHNEAFLAKNISKFFGPERVLDHIYFSVKQGSVTGLIGTSNAGKSVFIKLITGELDSSGGTGVVVDEFGKTYSLNKDRSNYLKRISFSPRNEVLSPYLTGLEMMHFIGRLRGIPTRYLNLHVTKWLRIMGFDTQLIGRLCSHYAPGMKRRLCLAMCLLGNCEVLVLDDPTVNLDALEHSHLWQILNLVKATGQAILLTHSSAKDSVDVMDKMIILGNGEIQALGTPEELFEKYAQGWTIIIRLREDNDKRLRESEIKDRADQLTEFVLTQLSPSTLKDIKKNYMLFHVTDRYKSLSEMYKKMEDIAEILSDYIDEYIIEEMDLDDLSGKLSEEHEMKVPITLQSLTSIHSVISATMLEVEQTQRKSSSKST